MKCGIERPREAKAEGIPVEGRGEAVRNRVTDSQAHSQPWGLESLPLPAKCSTQATQTTVRKARLTFSSQLLPFQSQDGS